MSIITQRRCILTLGLAIWLQTYDCASVGQSQEPVVDTRQRVGTVLGKPIYRDQLDDKKPGGLESSLRQVFLADVIKQYREEHAGEITPSETEIAAATEWFDERHRERIKDDAPKMRARLTELEQQALDPEFASLPEDEKSKRKVEILTLKARLNAPGKSFAVFMLRNWKFQKHLHENFGGGRLLWQQAGIEAFDATRKLLETLEAQKKFEIPDPEMRDLLYRYWTTQNHGAFLVDDKERIRTSLLEPDWLPATPNEQSPE